MRRSGRAATNPTVRAFFFWILILALASLGGAAIAQETPPSLSASLVQTRAEGLAQDAAAYAALFGLGQGEAGRRLLAQDASVALTEAIAATYRTRLAGISIEQQPFRISVLLTGDEPVIAEQLIADGSIVSIVFRTGAVATLDELTTALNTRQADLRAVLAHPPGMGVDQRTGELVIVVAGVDDDAEEHGALTTRLAAIAGVPVRVRSIDRPEVDQLGIDQLSPDQTGPQIGMDQIVEGGARLVGRVPGDSHNYLCTAGFAVTNGQRDGIVTAAHCPDTLAYIDAASREHSLPFVGQWGWGFQDVQVNLSDQPLAPSILVDPARAVSRPVMARRGASATRAGDVVCHRGERTGYSCGVVELTSFAPAGDLCGGACSPTWVTVSGPRCGGGDSGSPVFVGTTALGILKGGSYRADGSCGFYFYMPLDYLPNGWRLLTAPRPSVTPALVVASTPSPPM